MFEVVLLRIKWIIKHKFEDFSDVRLNKDLDMWDLSIGSTWPLNRFNFETFLNNALISQVEKDLGDMIWKKFLHSLDRTGWKIP